MPSDEKQLRRYEFKKALEELDGLKGRGTELISLYIPPEKMIYDIVQYLREEYSTSTGVGLIFDPPAERTNDCMKFLHQRYRVV